MMATYPPLYENGDYWVCKSAHGYEVYKTGITCSTRCGVIGYEGDEGFQRAKHEADRRALAACDALGVGGGQ